MPIRFRCSHCNRLLGIARRKAGTETKCPHCEGMILVPAEDAAEDNRAARRHRCAAGAVGRRGGGGSCASSAPTRSPEQAETGGCSLTIVRGGTAPLRARSRLRSGHEPPRRERDGSRSIEGRGDGWPRCIEPGIGPELSCPQPAKGHGARSDCCRSAGIVLHGRLSDRFAVKQFFSARPCGPSSRGPSMQCSAILYSSRSQSS